MTLDAETALSRLLDQGSPAGVWFLHGDAVRLRDEGVVVEGQGEGGEQLGGVRHEEVRQSVRRNSYS